MSDKTVVVKQAASTGFPVCTVLTIVLLLLKVIGGLDIPWLWVFSPLWIPAALTVLIFVGIGLVALVMVIISAIADRK